MPHLPFSKAFICPLTCLSTSKLSWDLTAFPLSSLYWHLCNQQSSFEFNLPFHHVCSGLPPWPVQFHRNYINEQPRILASAWVLPVRSAVTSLIRRKWGEDVSASLRLLPCSFFPADCPPRQKSFPSHSGKHALLVTSVLWMINTWFSVFGHYPILWDFAISCSHFCKLSIYYIFLWLS